MNQYGPWGANSQPLFRILLIGSGILRDVLRVPCPDGVMRLMMCLMDERVNEQMNNGWVDG